MEAARTSETAVPYRNATRHYNQDLNSTLFERDPVRPQYDFHLNLFYMIDI